MSWIMGRPPEMFPCLEFKWDPNYQDDIRKLLGQQKSVLWGTIHRYNASSCVIFSGLWKGQQFQSTWEPVYEAGMKGYVSFDQRKGFISYDVCKGYASNTADVIIINIIKY